MSMLTASHAPQTLLLEIRHVSMLRPFAWLWRGWQDMRQHWGASLGYGALTVALGWTLLVFCGTHPYFIAAAISGFLLVAPVMSAGMCEMSRRYSLRLSADFDESLDGFVRNRSALFEFGVILALCALAWFVMSAVLLGAVFHIASPHMSETLYRGFIDSTNREQVIAYLVIGGVLACAVFAVSVVAVPFIIDKQASAFQAIRASITVVLANPAAMIVWSALILLLTVVGYAPLLGGLLLIAPWLGHASWHAYRETVR